MTRNKYRAMPDQWMSLRLSDWRCTGNWCGGWDWPWPNGNEADRHPFSMTVDRIAVRANMRAMNCPSTEDCPKIRYNHFSSGDVDPHQDDWDDDTQGGADCDQMDDDAWATHGGRRRLQDLRSIPAQRQAQRRRP